MSTNEMTNGDALAAIAQEGGIDVLKLLGDVMETNARQAAWIEEQVRLGQERDVKRAQDERDFWVARCKKMEERILWLLGYDDELPFRDEDIPFA